MFQPRQNDLFTGFLNFACQEHLVENRIHLVKIENEVQLADVSEEGVQHLYEEVDGLEVSQLIVVGVDAHAEEEAGVSTVYDLVVSEFDKVGLVFLVSGGDEAMDFTFELYFFFVGEGGVPLC